MLIVVDGANVVGSRPDGWWRDRGAAARRLADRLVGWLAGRSADAPAEESADTEEPAGALAAALPDHPDLAVVLVLEGAARHGVPEGPHPTVPLRVVHAPADGDAVVVREVRAGVAAGGPVLAVTADRALAARVGAAGGAVVGPSQLARLLAP